jgi:hypothetical protein
MHRGYMDMKYAEWTFSMDKQHGDMEDMDMQRGHEHAGRTVTFGFGREGSGTLGSGIHGCCTYNSGTLGSGKHCYEELSSSGMIRNT